MYKFSTKGIVSRRLTIKVNNRRVGLLILSPVKKTGKTTGVMWIHGGGYMTGVKEMAYIGRAADLVRNPTLSGSNILLRQQKERI